MADLTIDEIMALGEQHTAAMKKNKDEMNGKKKKKEDPNMKQKGLAESGYNQEVDKIKLAEQYDRERRNGLSRMFGIGR